MKKLMKIFGIILVVVVVVLVGASIYMKNAFPKVSPPPNLKVEITPGRVERGKYLANHVTVCIDCHATRDWSKFSGPVIPGTEGKGGERFDETMGFPGEFYSKNITPYGVSTWTDGELFRAITSGVNRNGEPFFPVMPYPGYSHLDPEDIYSIIAYIRTLAPIKNDVPESAANFPMNFILRTIPKDANFTKMPDKSNIEAYGKYLVTASACIDCHTQFEQGSFVEGMEFAGGREFQFPTGEVLRSSNISPDNETGIGKWTKDEFINKFKSFDKPEMRNVPVKAGEFNTIMPWTMYGGMTVEDLSAIYSYLRTVKAINNEVEKFSKAGIR
jgi:mono/diheme cytochrome c family protein